MTSQRGSAVDKQAAWNRQKLFCGQIQLLQCFALTDNDLDPAPEDMDDGLQAQLRDLNTIAICLMTGGSGDVVAVAQENSARKSFILARNSAPTDVQKRQSDDFFKSLWKNQIDPRRQLLEILNLLHGYSEQAINRRKDKLRKACERVLHRAKSLPDDIKKRLKSIKDLARNITGQTAIKSQKLLDLTSKCSSFLSVNQRGLEQKFSDKADGSDEDVLGSLVILRRELHKVVLYNVGLVHLIESARTEGPWEYHWIEETPSSAGALERPFVPGKLGVPIPNVAQIWRESGIEIPMTTKRKDEFTEEELRKVVQERHPSITDKRMLKALEQKLGPLIEVQCDDEELKRKLTTAPGQGRPIIQKDSDWKTHLTPALHAELRIILALDGVEPGPHGKVKPIGVSKRCCAACSLYIRLYNEKHRKSWGPPGNHKKWYPNWSAPGFFLPEDIPEAYKQKQEEILEALLAEIVRELGDRLTRLHKGSRLESDDQRQVFTWEELTKTIAP